MAVTFLNKLYVKAIFSDAQQLNLTAYDLGENMISVTIDDDVVNRLKTATGTVASLAIIVGVTAEVEIVKTSSAYSEWTAQILSSGWIGGTCTLYDDVNQSYTMNDISISIKNLPNVNGTEPAVTFQVQGNLEVNRDALNL